ncbi:hypothetical protein GYB22_01255 [bacterium]|nr:hypothetical protein [bacterium]
MLSILTQIGGILYIINRFIWNKYINKRRWQRSISFIAIYSIFTFLITPPLASLFGRTKIQNSARLKPVNFITVFFNRNYVTPELEGVINQCLKENKDLHLVYFDACFPFFDGFPLIPHLSHNDGKKIDLGFQYDFIDSDQYAAGKVPGIFGYGAFVELKREPVCPSTNYPLYSITSIFSPFQRKDLQFSESKTKKLIETLANHPKTEKIFIEPFLKETMNLTSSKIRFHGCHAVRHDDHIHLQIR